MFNIFKNKITDEQINKCVMDGIDLMIKIKSEPVERQNICVQLINLDTNRLIALKKYITDNKINVSQYITHEVPGLDTISFDCKKLTENQCKQLNCICDARTKL